MDSKTKVLFRKDNYGIIAYFPEISESKTDPMICMCYSHVGQHSSAHIEYIQTETKSCTEEEYSSLKKELEYIGYELKVIKRMSREMHENRIDDMSFVI
jgi:hypothetical protein